MIMLNTARHPEIANPLAEPLNIVISVDLFYHWIGVSGGKDTREGKSLIGLALAVGFVPDIARIDLISGAWRSHRAGTFDIEEILCQTELAA